MVLVDVSMSVLNVLVNLLLIPTWGAVGAAIGTSVTLLLHNILKQWGLRRFTSIQAFPRETARLYLGIAGFALAALGVATFLPSNLVVAVVISAAGGIFGLVLGWRSLQVAALFPEIHRIPFYARLARLTRRGDRGSGDPDDLGG
jgi:O-antigen/teichoic acid export membrane protein